jgi:hypothetical protein
MGVEPKEQFFTKANLKTKYNTKVQLFDISAEDILMDKLASKTIFLFLPFWVI